MTDLDAEFHAFAERFIRHYCEEIVTESPEFADHQEPCEQSLEEVLAEFTFVTTSHDDDSIRIFEMQMLRSSADVSDSWELGFCRDGEKWVLASAIAYSSKTDMLDEVYGPYFKSFFKRVIGKAACPV